MLVFLLEAQSASASSLSKYFPRVLELMADAALNPVFTQEEFDKQMKQSLTELKTLKRVLQLLLVELKVH